MHRAHPKETTPPVSGHFSVKVKGVPNPCPSQRVPSRRAFFKLSMAFRNGFGLSKALAGMPHPVAGGMCQSREGRHMKDPCRLIMAAASSSMRGRLDEWTRHGRHLIPDEHGHGRRILSSAFASSTAAGVLTVIGACTARVAGVRTPLKR